MDATYEKFTTCLVSFQRCKRRGGEQSCGPKQVYGCGKALELAEQLIEDNKRLLRPQHTLLRNFQLWQRLSQGKAWGNTVTLGPALATPDVVLDYLKHAQAAEKPVSLDHHKAQLKP